MKTKQLLKLSLFLFCSVLINISSVNAQDTLTNQELNRWEKSGKQPPFDWSEPQGWTSSNPLTEFISAGIKEVQMQSSGSSQAEIKTLNVFGQPVPGVLINGDFNLQISDTANFPLVGGEPMTQVKTKLYGMYNFTAVDTTDSAMVIVAFKKFNTSTQQAEAVAVGTAVLPQTSPGLHSFVININPITFDTPDSVAVTMLSSKSTNLKQGGVLTVDRVSFTPLTSVKKPSNEKGIKVWPSPATTQLNISTQQGVEYAVFDITGKVLLYGTATSDVVALNVASFKSGCYYVKVQSDKTEVIRFLKQ
jgi:hypothetical protein